MRGEWSSLHSAITARGIEARQLFRWPSPVGVGLGLGGGAVSGAGAEEGHAQGSVAERRVRCRAVLLRGVIDRDEAGDDAGTRDEVKGRGWGVRC